MADIISVNSGEWQVLSDADKTKLTAILTKSGLLRDATIQPDASAPKALKQASASGGGLPVQPAFLGINFCEIACDVAEAGAVAACGSLTGPAAAVCIAAAHAAANLCRSKC